jgi:mannose-6-phosphate isomerase
MIFALSDPFDALCGFREPADSRAALERLAGDDPAVAAFAATLEGEPAAVLRRATEWLLGGSPEVSDVVDAVVAAAQQADGVDADTVRMLAAAFPGDPGIVLALLLNRVALRPGDALYLPAGNIHAYLRGLGIELMAASDNVLRGGLTPKRIDVPELVRILDFAPFAVTPMVRERPAPGVEEFVPDVPDFRLIRIEVGGDVTSASVDIPGTAIVLCTAGEVEVEGATEALRLGRGEAAVVTVDERTLSVVGGAGTLFVATPNR